MASSSPFCCCRSITINGNPRKKWIKLSSSTSFLYPTQQDFCRLLSKFSSPGGVFCVPKARKDDDDAQFNGESAAVEEEARVRAGAGIAMEEAMPAKDFVTIAACLVGLLTGVAVVLFNAAVDEILVSDIFHLEGIKCQVWTTAPHMTLVAAERIMDSHGVHQLPVVSERIDGHDRGHSIGLLDRECISIACRYPFSIYACRFKSCCNKRNFQSILHDEKARVLDVRWGLKLC